MPKLTKQKNFLTLKTTLALLLLLLTTITTTTAQIKAEEGDEEDDNNDDQFWSFLSVKFVRGFTASFMAILVSEIGDKTFFIAAIMSMVS